WVTAITGPVERLGALGPMHSVYCRDPEGNLIEIATYLTR
ncbi:MAG: VOC family protein, partial [Acetobacteraceae bacterium]|nr:VOC family protein [Acetobacteraceae bacterium]